MSSCVECGRDYDLLEHHVSYEPEETVKLCHPCHTRVHRDDDHELHPNRVPPERQRNRAVTRVRVTADVRLALREYMRQNDHHNEDEALREILPVSELRSDATAREMAQKRGDRGQATAMAPYAMLVLVLALLLMLWLVFP